MTLNKKWLLSLMLAAFVALLAACGEDEGASDDNKEETETTQEEQQEGEQAETPEPDLENVPDVVAEVNGEKITKEDFETTYQGQFQQMAMQSQMTGTELDQEQLKKDVANNLVGQELLVQEAESRDYEVSDEEVNQMLTDLAEQNQMESKDKFLEELANQGMKEDEVLSQVRSQLKVDQLLEEEVSVEAPTDDEVKAEYDKAVEQQESAETEQEMPAYEDVKDKIKQNLQTQKQSEETQKLVDKLREEGEVTVNL
ncbi:SurA N-terminal domain-containing protein [Halobacillus litoralis]|uniref:SurA N-terminal domain-containing protein n=1 Tax=Halobacillus litoralis TaxID=45668 RepID=UPI001CD2327D|nr:SurA N-terminal domain-containing protein [Halobacillus litoralis]MCA1022217.1 SurA N-terminal domain-containing protein [Halobacillus litoralis]